LFSPSAHFRVSTPWFTASRLDSRIRINKNMPSCSDESVEKALSGVEQVLLWGRQWLAKSASPLSMVCLDHLKRADRAARAIEAHTVSRNMTNRMGDRVVAEIAALTGVSVLCSETERAKEPGLRLDTAIRCLLDFAMLSDSKIKPRYLNRLYRTLDTALEYNATSDADRNRNVILWLRELLEAAGRRRISYVDVGCSFRTGATNTILAADILRPGGLCADLHGTDIVAPPAELVGCLLRQHRIHLYQADPVRRPLSRRYDAIMLANVHRHLDAGLQRELLNHLAASLTENGLLIINWRFDATNSPCLCLQLHGKSMTLAAATNVAVSNASKSN